MGKLFHPQWAKNNGDIGGQVYLDWFAELEKFGPEGVLRGIKEVKASGASYAPNLNKFAGFCQKKNSQPTSGDYGPWETCPHTGRQRRLKPGYELLAESLGSKDDPRTHEEIRQDIESMIASEIA